MPHKDITNVQKGFITEDKNKGVSFKELKQYSFPPPEDMQKYRNINKDFPEFFMNVYKKEQDNVQERVMFEQNAQYSLNKKIVNSNNLQLVGVFLIQAILIIGGVFIAIFVEDMWLKIISIILPPLLQIFPFMFPIKLEIIIMENNNEKTINFNFDCIFLLKARRIFLPILDESFNEILDYRTL